MNIPHPLQILLLEDHGQLRAGFKSTLTGTMPTARIHEAADYRRAVDILSDVKIDFAFLDIDLSGSKNSQSPHHIQQKEVQKNGLDVLQYIHANKLNTRAIMLSGYDNEELVLQCLRAGASGYIPKAIDGNDILCEALGSVLRGRIFLPESVMGRKEGGALLTKTLEEFGVKGKVSDVLYYLCQGDVDKRIATKTGLAGSTVREYVSGLLQKFEVKNRTQLTIRIDELGINIPKPKSNDCDLND